MSLLLAIDTSAQQCRVGLADDGNLIDEATGDGSRRAAQEVLPLIDDVLAGQRIGLDKIDFLSVVSGPGSFTGLRIGVAVAQALSFTQNIPVVPIPSMALLAWAAMKRHEADRWLVFETAREPEVYFGFYRCESDKGALLQGQEQVASVTSLKLPESANSVFMQNDNWGLVGSACAGVANTLKIGEGVGSYPDLNPCTQELCELSTLYHRAGSYEEHLILPNYVKERMDYS